MQYRVYAIKYTTLYGPTSLENFEKKNRVLLFALLSSSNSTIKGKRKMQKGTDRNLTQQKNYFKYSPRTVRHFNSKSGNDVDS